MVRTAGVLLHLTSLPSRFGSGDLGPAAGEFARWLALAGARLWQILPVTPTGPGLGNSPYSSYSAFAGNPLLISPELLAEEGLLPQAALTAEPAWPRGRADFEKAWAVRGALLRQAFDRARPSLEKDRAFTDFCRDNGTWLNDFALFMAVKERLGGGSWAGWPEDLRDREETALARWGTELAGEVLYQKFLQHHFFMQWGRFRALLASLDIELVGDLPIYVNHDSSDVWANRDLFKLDEEGQPLFVAGVPPDYFSKTGQRWGNPVYDWEACRARGFDWWIARLWHHFGLFDRVRLDHFRGFAGYWEIPAGEKTAVRGRWVPAAGRELFLLARERIGRLPLLAEDLGVITPDVVALREEFGFPSMRVLQFGWAGDPVENDNAFHNCGRNCVAFTGTHDNSTTRGWYAAETTPADRKRLRAYLGRRVDASSAAWDLVRLCLMSPAETAVIPVQDLLNLDNAARMNVPGQAKGNWGFRLLPGQLDAELAKKFLDEITLYGRHKVPAAPDGVEKDASGPDPATAPGKPRS